MIARIEINTTEQAEALRAFAKALKMKIQINSNDNHSGVSDWFDELTENQKRLLEKGEQDLKENRTYTHQQIEEKIKNHLERNFK
ncbi:MAG: hypothetical protein K1X55_14570 [Chitinophagales bacterium]|nr:hypothetical protein [Chitinophagales bacterium]